NALDQTLPAEPGADVSGKQLWPHHDNTPGTKRLTYRNSGSADITLELTLDARNPAGGPAPAGVFALDRQRVTVPAGGTADVGLTTDTRITGGGEGRYSATVVATGGGQTVRTPAAVEREIESYDVTVRGISRDGAPDPNGRPRLAGYEGLGAATYHEPVLVNGTGTVRVPKGRYFVDYISEPGTVNGAIDFLHQHKMGVAGDTRDTPAAGHTNRGDIPGPPGGGGRGGAEFWSAIDGPVPYSTGVYAGSFTSTRVAGIGTADHPLTQVWMGVWSKDATLYAMQAGGRVERLATGYTKRYTTADMARVTIRAGGSVPGKYAAVRPIGTLPGRHPNGPIDPAPLPADRPQTVWVPSEGGLKWNFAVTQQSAPELSPYETTHQLPAPRRFIAGQSYDLTLGGGAQGPTLPEGYGGVRDGDRLSARVPLITDGAGNPGTPLEGRIETTLHRDGVLVGRNEDPLTGRNRGKFTVPAEDAAYTLATTVERPVGIERIATRVETSWTFRSARAAAPTELPLSTVRFGARAGLDSTAPAGRVQLFPVTVQGAAAGTNLKSLTTEVSYDEGRTWKPLTVVQGWAAVTNPAAGKGVSFRAEVVDRQGNRSSVTVVNAYLGK
ncbi:peptidase S8, partial [Streptomyces sp. NPDC058953]